MWDTSSPDQWSNLCPLHWEALGVLINGPPGSDSFFWDITHHMVWYDIPYQKIYPFRVYNYSVFLVHSQNYASNTLMNFRTHSFSSQRTLYPSSVSPQLPLPRQPLCWLLLCVNLIGSQHVWIFGQTLLWVCLQGCFWMMLTFESVDWIKPSLMWVGLI